MADQLEKYSLEEVEPFEEPKPERISLEDASPATTEDLYGPQPKLSPEEELQYKIGGDLNHWMTTERSVREAERANRSGVMNAMQSTVETVQSKLPWVRDFKPMVDALDAEKAMNAMLSGKYTAAEARAAARALLDDEEEAQSQANRGIPSKVVDLATDLPATFAEFGAGGQAAKSIAGAVTGKLAKSQVLRGIAQQIASKAAASRLAKTKAAAITKTAVLGAGGILGAEAVRTAVNLPSLAAGTAENMTPQLEDGKLVEGDSAARGLTRAFANDLIENVSERMGTAGLGIVAKKAGVKLLGPERAEAFAKSVMKLSGADKLAAIKNRLAHFLADKYGLAVPEAAKKLAGAVAFNGILGEYLEERYGEGMKLTANQFGLDLVDPKDTVVGDVAGGVSSLASGDVDAAKKQFGEALEQTIVEGAAFAIPGVVARVGGAIQKQQQDKQTAQQQAAADFDEAYKRGTSQGIVLDEFRNPTPVDASGKAAPPVPTEAGGNSDTVSQMNAPPEQPAPQQPQAPQAKQQPPVESVPQAAPPEVQPAAPIPSDPVAAQRRVERLAELDAQLNGGAGRQLDNATWHKLQLERDTLRHELKQEVPAQQPAAQAEPIPAKPVEPPAPPKRNLNPPKQPGDDLRRYGVESELVEQAPTPVHEEAAQLARDLGLEPKFVKLSDPTFGGFRNGKTVYIDANRTDADQVWYIAGHEIAHGTGVDDVVKDLAKGGWLEDYTKNVPEGSPYAKYLAENPQKLEREAAAHMIGTFIANKDFRDRLAERDQSLFQRVVTAVKQFFAGKKLSPTAQKVLDALKAQKKPLGKKPGFLQGATVTTNTGRSIPAPPMIRTDSNRRTSADLKSQRKWLLEQAKAEAAARKDEYNLNWMNGENAEQELPPATMDSLNEYLFGETNPEWKKNGNDSWERVKKGEVSKPPAVPKPILKPLGKKEPDAPKVEPKAETPPTIRLMSTELNAEPFFTTVSNGVKTEIFVSTKTGEAVMRMTDTDAEKVVGLKKYPNVEMAVKDVKRHDEPKEEPESQDEVSEQELAEARSKRVAKLQEKIKTDKSPSVADSYEIDSVLEGQRDDDLRAEILAKRNTPATTVETKPKQPAKPTLADMSEAEIAAHIEKRLQEKAEAQAAEKLEEQPSEPKKLGPIVIKPIFGGPEVRLNVPEPTVQPKKPLGKQPAAETEKPKTEPKKKPLGKKQAAPAVESAKAEFAGAMDELTAALKKRGLMANPQYDPELIGLTAKVVAKGIKLGIVKFADLVNTMKDTLGDAVVRRIGPMLRDAWGTVREDFAVNTMDEAGDVEAILGPAKQQAAEAAEDSHVGKSGVVDKEQGSGDGSGQLGADAPAVPRKSLGKRGAKKRLGKKGDGVLSDDGEAPRGAAERTGGTPEGASSTGNADADQSELAGRETAERGTEEAPQAIPEELKNHVIQPDEVLAVRGEIESARRNIAAIKLLKKLEAESRDATPEEKRVLAQFSGWGKLAPAFDRYKYEAITSGRSWSRDLNWEKKWASTYKELVDGLTEKEWEAARDTTINAHYTSKTVIEKMWDLVDRLGFKGGRILEPGAGIGHFAGLIPAKYREGSKFVLVEMDELSSRLLKKLYPQADVHGQAMETFRIAPGSVDLVVGNVPFAKDSHMDDAKKRYGITLNLHNYFIARSLDAVRPGGLVVVISTHHTLDSAAEQRKLLADKGDLIGAIRLPNNAFSENAGTEVVTDILVFRKPVNNERIGQPFTATKKVEIEGARSKDERINEYFVDHPEMVLGTNSLEGTMYRGDEYTVKPTPGELAPKITKAIESFPEGVATAEQAKGVIVNAAPGEDVREGEIRIVKGKVQLGVDGNWTKLAEGQAIDGYPKNLFTKAGLKRAEGYVAIRDSYRKLRETMLNPEATDADVAKAQKELGKLYDDYVSNHGQLNESKTNIFARDPEFYRVLSLEDESAKSDPVTQKIKYTYRKAPVFTKRTMGPRTPPAKVESIKDALWVSLGYRGKLDVDYMAQLTGMSKIEVALTLGKEGLAFRDPKGGEFVLRERYLSGNVKRALREALVAVEDDAAYQVNVDALQAVQPERVGISKVSVRLGSNWIPENVATHFARKLFNDPDAKVTYGASTDTWTVTGNKSGVAASQEWAVKTEHSDKVWNGLELLDWALNLKTPKITYQQETGEYDDRGRAKTTTVIDDKATVAAKALTKKMQDEFRKLIDTTPKVAELLEDVYNERFNSYVDAKYDGTHLELPGANTEIELRPYQKNAIWRILQDGYALLAHAVGAGKTYTMIGAAMEMRRLGLAKRPILVVQNATLGQFATSFMRMYPNANVLVADVKDLTKNRQMFLSRISSGDWDAVVMAQSTFDRLSSKPEVEQQFIDDKLTELETAIHEAGGEKDKSPKVKDLVRARNSLKKRLDDILTNEKKNREKNTLYFEDLDSDALFLDEAHAYKKPFFITKLDNLVGLNKQCSARGVSTSMKVRTIQARNQGKGVIFATGTPITNTMGEAWHMMNFIAPQINQDFSVDTFDGFIGSFALQDTIYQQNAGGVLVPKDAIVKFVNGPELLHYIRAGWDILSPDDLKAYMEDAGAGLPKLRGGKPQSVSVELTPGVEKFTNFIKDVYAKFKALPGKERRLMSYIPAIGYGASKAASLDIRLVYPNAKEEAGSKTAICAENAIREYHASSDVKGTQLIFSDVFNHRSMDKLNAFMAGENVDTPVMNDSSAETEDDEKKSFLFQDIKKKLIAGGIPAAEIAIVAEADTDAKREALFDRVKSGDVRIMLGSSAKMGVGVNVQDKLIALHHLDAPWLPADIEQREGRIIRYGNQNKEVSVYRYAMKNTLDGTILEKTIRKGKFIWQVMAGKLEGREFEDPASELTLSMEEQLAAINGDPRFYQKLEVERQKRDLELEKEAFGDSIARNRDYIRSYTEEVGRLQEQTIPTQQALIKQVDSLSQDSALELDGKSYSDSKEDLKAADAALKAFKEAHEKKIVAETKADKLRGYQPNSWNALGNPDNLSAPFKIGGLELSFASGAWQRRTYEGKTEWYHETIAVVRVPGGKQNLYDGSATTLDGLTQTVKNLPERLKSSLQSMQAKVAQREKEIGELKELVERGWPGQDKLDELTKKYNELSEAVIAASAAEEAARDARRAEEKKAREQQQETLGDAPSEDSDEPDAMALPKKILGKKLVLPENDARTANPTQQTLSRKNLTGEEKATIAAADILKTWERLFEVPLRVGGFSQQASGIYKRVTGRAPEIVRMKEHFFNLAVGSHEIAHHIDRKTSATATLRKLAAQDIDNYKAILNELEGLDYEPRGRVKEGWAEFIRHYITEGDAQNLGEHLYPWFTDVWMKENPEWAKRINEARDHARNYADQSVFQRIRSMMQPSDDLEWSERWKREAKQFGRRTVRRWVDRFNELKVLQEEAKSRGLDSAKKAGVYELAMAYDMTAPANAMMALEEGVHSIRDGRKFGKSLWNLKQYVNNQVEYDEAIAYGLAKHTLFMQERRPEYFTGLTVGDAQAWVDYISEDAEKLKRYDSFVKGLARFNNELLEMLVDAGALSSTDRDKMIEEYGEDYYPLQRIKSNEEVERLSRSGTKFVNLPKVIKGRSRHGSTRPILDPFDATISRAIYFYGRAAKVRVIHTLAETLDPALGGVSGMGGLMDRIDPSKIVHEGTIEEILKTLVEEGVVTEDAARQMRIAATIRKGGMPKKENLAWFAVSRGLDENADMTEILSEVAKVPEILATISLWREDFTPNSAKATVVIHDANGQPTLYELDRELYNTVAGMDPLQLDSFSKILSSASKVFKAGAVNLSTGFGAANVLRDYLEFQGRAEQVKGAKSLVKPIELAAHYIGQKSRQVAGLDFDSALIRTFEEMGGKLYNILGNDIASRRAVRERKLGLTHKPLGTAPTGEGMTGIDLTGVDWLEHPVESLQDMIALTDAPPRLAEFEACLNSLGFFTQGDHWVDANGRKVDLPEYARVRAINAAGNATINFKRSGTWARWIDARLPFVNAQIQAKTREGSMLLNLRKLGTKTEEGQRAKRFLIYLSAAAASGAAIYLTRGDDDDYREQEDWIRQNYWTLGWNGRTVLRVPKPRDLGQLVANFVEAAFNEAHHDDSAGAMKDVAKQFGLNSLPSSGGLPRVAVETFVANYDYFADRPIVPEYLEDDPKQLQFTPYTLETSKAIASVTAKRFGISPLQVEHLLNGSTGGAYRRLVGTAEAMREGRAGPENLPFARAFVLNRHQARSLDDFYTTWKQVNLQAKEEEAEGGVKKETAEQKGRLDDYAQMMTEIRKNDKRDLRGRREMKFEPYLVGLAREALRRAPLESNPSPFTSKDVPSEVADVIRQFAEQRAKTVVLSEGYPEKTHKGDKDFAETLAKWEAGRKLDAAWLKEHRDSPYVREALEQIRGSGKFRKLMLGRPGAPEDYLKWMEKVQNATSWLGSE